MNGLANVGVPEPPPGDFFRWVRNTLVDLQAALIPPDVVTNMRATALSGAIQVDFTRSDGDAYTLYWNTTPSLNGSVRIDLGTSNKYVDDIGAGSVKRFYAVRSLKGSVRGPVSAWVSATSLALGTAITPPTPPPAGGTPTVDQETEAIEPGYPGQTGYSL